MTANLEDSMKLYQDIPSWYVIPKITKTKLEAPRGLLRPVFQNQMVFYKKLSIKNMVLNNVFKETSIYYI